MLTQQQVQHFETFGFLVIRAAFSAAEMAAITAEFEASLLDDRGGRAFGGEERQAVFGMVERRPQLMQLAEDDRIFGPMEQILGEGFVWVGSDGNYWVGDTQWHPDRHDRTWPLIKASLYLDPVTRETGCLRVIPGSHRTPFWENLAPLERTMMQVNREHGMGMSQTLEALYLPGEDKDAPPMGVPGRDIPSAALETEPGDLILFQQNLWHASFGGGSGRRQLALSFGLKPTTDLHFAQVRQVHSANLAGARERGNVDGDRLFDDAFVKSDSPRIRGLVAPFVELGLM